MYILLNEGVGQTRNHVLGASPVGLGKCPHYVGDCQYPVLSVPPSLRGPSGEPGQILLEGTAKKITLYHGFYTELSRSRDGLARPYRLTK